MRYYISDLHFYHDALNHVMDQRGFRDAQDMNEHMICQWNSRVRKNDEVVVLGDFSMEKWEKTKAVLEQLKGKIYLIQGNHDRFVKDKDFERRFLEIIHKASSTFQISWRIRRKTCNLFHYTT